MTRRGPNQQVENRPKPTRALNRWLHQQRVARNRRPARPGASGPLQGRRLRPPRVPIRWPGSRWPLGRRATFSGLFQLAPRRRRKSCRQCQYQWALQAGQKESQWERSWPDCIPSPHGKVKSRAQLASTESALGGPPHQLSLWNGPNCSARRHLLRAAAQPPDCVRRLWLGRAVRRPVARHGFRPHRSRQARPHPR